MCLLFFPYPSIYAQLYIVSYLQKFPITNYQSRSIWDLVCNLGACNDINKNVEEDTSLRIIDNSSV